VTPSESQSKQGFYFDIQRYNVRTSITVESASELTGDGEGEHAGVSGDDPQQAEDPQSVDTGQ
jgi:hypothetical protein